MYPPAAANKAVVRDSLLGRWNPPFIHAANYGASWAVSGQAAIMHNSLEGGHQSTSLWRNRDDLPSAEIRPLRATFIRVYGLPAASTAPRRTTDGLSSDR
jgi:hypothetical protein